jgi:hypothetical protein
VTEHSISALEDKWSLCNFALKVHGKQKQRVAEASGANKKNIIMWVSIVTYLSLSFKQCMWQGCMWRGVYVTRGVCDVWRGVYMTRQVSFVFTLTSFQLKRSPQHRIINIIFACRSAFTIIRVPHLSGGSIYDFNFFFFLFCVITVLNSGWCNLVFIWHPLVNQVGQSSLIYFHDSIAGGS